MRWHRRFGRQVRHSIRWRLVALFLLLALATTAVFLGGTQRLLRSGWQGYAQPLVADYVDRLAAEIGSPPNVARAQALVARLPVSVRIEGTSVNWESHPGRRRWGDAEPHDYGSFSLQRTTADGHRLTFGLGSLPPEARPRAIGWGTLALLLALTAVAYLVVRKWLRPLQEIGAGAERFGRGEFGQPITLRRNDELGDLAARINAMAASLKGRLDAQRALLLAISHELRSPLTRARVNAELVGEGPEREALLRDLGEMRDLIADLLESERLAAGHGALHPEPTDIDALVREVVAAFPQREGQGDLVELQLAAGPVLRRLDRARVKLLLRNLIDNALRHGAEAGRPPVIRTEPDGTGVRLVVRDFGPGVPPEQLARLGEAFYRPDAARTRRAGGVGLGLFLCARVAAAHGGALAFANAQPGLQVTATLPG